LLNALAQFLCRYMELLYFAGQVDAREPAPSHNIMLYPVFFAIDTVQIEEYNIMEELYIWAYV
jgi:hypothetical protein